MEVNISLSSFNCRGLRDGTKRRSIFRWLKTYHNGIILLQETHSTLDVEQTWRREWGGEICFCHGTNASKGVAILFPKHFHVEVNNCVKDDNGRMLLLDIEIDKLNMIIVNIYAPTKDNEKDQITFIDMVANFLYDNMDRNILVGGDFNVCLEPALDKSGGNIVKKSTYAERICCIKEELNLGDIWRILNPDTRRFTWRSHTRNGFVQTRLDFWLLSIHMMYDIVSTDIKPSIKSDHSLINIVFKVTSTENRGQGFWKFNASLLRDQEYVRRIKECIHECKIRYEDINNKGLIWDAVKCDIRTSTISYASYKAKETKKVEQDLLKRINCLEKSLGEATNNMTEYKNLKTEFEEIQSQKARGIMIRSRATEVENNEKCTKYFLSLEKRNYYTKNIKTLVNTKGNIISNHDAILKEQEDFYKSLYTERKNDNDHEIKECDIITETPTLNDEQKSLCETQISIGELAKSLKKLPNNKAPGCDGLTTDFYKFFWVDIKDLLFNSYLYGYHHGILSLDQRRAILNLIPKPDKDLRYLKNWRPLSLLNTDYKILAKTLASRLQDVIGSLINEDQTGCLAGRFIGENLRTIIDTFDFTTLNNIPGLMVMLDFEKAFDSVSWKYLFEILERFNFGENFIHWIKTLYSKPLICVTNNGFSTSFFPISRGIRQGCPISALLFLLVAETMAIHIRQNNDIKGIEITPKCTVKLMQYADDTTLFLKDQRSLACLFEFLLHFGKCSGLNINKEKTVIITLGPLACDKILGIKCSKEPIKTLGIWISKNTHEMTEINFREKIGKLQTILNMWRQRSLSLKGKVVVIQSLCLSQLQYVSTILYVPSGVIDEVNQLIFSFLWPKKVHVKKDVVIQNIESGGLKMPDYDYKVRTTKVMWVKRLLNESKCSELAKVMLKIPISFKDFCLFKNDVSFLPDNFPIFYKQILQYWFELYSVQPKTVSDIKAECLWFNKFILIDKQPFYYKKAHDNGLCYISDLFDGNGRFLELDVLNRTFQINLDILTYNSLKSAIPTDWRKAIKNSTDTVVKPKNQIYINGFLKDIKVLESRDVYSEFVRNERKKPAAVSRWETIYENVNFEWEHIFTIPYMSARDTKLQSLQYQVLHRFYPTNSNLSKWFADHNDRCLLCNIKDTIEHYFYYCDDVQQFWNMFMEWWHEVTLANVQLTLFDIIFGIVNEQKDMIIDSLNFLILLGKWFISNQKKKERQCNFEFFLKLVKQRLTAEEHICIEKGTFALFEKKWLMFKDALNS